MITHNKWKTTKSKRRSTQERWAFSAGQKAFRMKIAAFGNPYGTTELRTSWIRGYKQAEREFVIQIKVSRAIEASLPFEEEE